MASARGKKLTNAPASWDDIQDLALSINGYEVAGDDGCGKLANALSESYGTIGDRAFAEVSTSNIRCALFFEQRRWWHFGEEPGPEATAYILALVTELARRNGIPWLWDQVAASRNRQRSAP